MKYLIAALTALALCCNVALAETKIGTIDLRAALSSSQGAKAFTEGLMEEFKEDDEAVRQVSEEGKKLEQRLKNDGAIMSDAERAKLVSELEEKIQEYKFLKGRLDSALNKKRQEFFLLSKPKLDKAIDELVAEEKLDLLLPRESALYAQESMDYTAKVIEKLNKLK